MNNAHDKTQSTLLRSSQRSSSYIECASHLRSSAPRISGLLMSVSVWVQLLLSLFLFFSCFTIFAHAATDSFNVRTIIDADMLPPTIPTGLVATPITISQINLAWASSTDDSGTVSGYHVWRDDVLIATTTGTAFSDTGLASSTVYVYYVTAFDAFMNESASSTSATGTTPAPPPIVTPTDDGSQYGSKLTPFEEMITSLEVLPGKDTVTIRYVTKVYVRTTTQWGRSVSYELGSLAEEAHRTRHETSIAGLTPGTTYSFIVRGEDRLGRDGVLYEGTFATLPPDDTFAPGNVTELTATREGDDVLLSWVNPEDTDFVKVRVLRSDRFYPSDTQDGWVVYEGPDAEVRDLGAATGTKQYYTVFTYDALGNVSSGAVVVIRFLDDETATSTTDVMVDPTKNELKLYFDDLAFTQDGKRLYVDDTGRVYVDGAKQLTVSIPYERLPEHLKTILITLEDARNSKQTFSFLLRVDEARTVYTGTLAPLGVDGDFSVTLTVFDYTTAQIGYTKGVLVSSIRPIHTDSDVEGFIGWIVDFFNTMVNFYVLWFVILLTLLMLLSRRLLRTKY